MPALAAASANTVDHRNTSDVGLGVYGCAADALDTGCGGAAGNGLATIAIPSEGGGDDIGGIILWRVGI